MHLPFNNLKQLLKILKQYIINCSNFLTELRYVKQHIYTELYYKNNNLQNTQPCRIKYKKSASFE